MGVRRSGGERLEYGGIPPGRRPRADVLGAGKAYEAALRHAAAEKEAFLGRCQRELAAIKARVRDIKEDWHGCGDDLGVAQIELGSIVGGLQGAVEEALRKQAAMVKAAKVELISEPAAPPSARVLATPPCRISQADAMRSLLALGFLRSPQRVIARRPICSMAWARVSASSPL